MVSSPSWSLLLSYEHAIRKKMVLLVNKGQTVKESLKLAMEDPVTMERFFTTPLCIEAVSGKRPAPSDWGYAETAGSASTQVQNNKKGKGPKWSGKGKSKEGGKGKSKRRGEHKDRNCASKTPDGANICFKFNQAGCSVLNCPFVHVCGKCFTANVPMSRCKLCGTGPA